MKEKPILYFNTDRESKEAYLLIKSLGLPCEFRAPCLDTGVPLLLIGYQQFIGIREITQAIKGSY